VISSRQGTRGNTSPELIEGVVLFMRGLGREVGIGGNPPRALPGPQMIELFQRLGLTAVAERTAAPLLLDQRTTVVPLPSGRSAKFFAIAEYVATAGSVVVVPHLRSDTSLMSGAVRGTTSAVPGFKREEIKLDPDQIGRYADQLIDLTLVVRPNMVVLEAGTESDKQLIISANPFAADFVAAQHLGLEPLSVPTIAAAARRELGPSSGEGIDVVTM
jgi:uncharacterized protein (DUF362 family)